MPACAPLLLAWAGLWPAAPGPQERGTAAELEGEDELVRLRDGRVLVGAIVRHDLDGLEIRAARDGGRFVLSWDDLHPGEAERLRAAFGYREEVGVPLVNAARLLLRNGREEVGVVLRRDERGIELREREIVKVVPLEQLAAPPETVLVAASLVYTPEQYYAWRAAEVPEGDALRQYDFARELQAVFALEQAAAHLEKARALAAAAGDQALLRRVEGAAQALARTIAHRAEAERLEQVRQLVHRERFAEAEELLASYEEDFPQGGLRGEFLDLKDRFEEQRVAGMTAFLARSWFNVAAALLRRKALDREAAVDALMDFAEENVPAQVRKSLLADLKKTYKGDADEALVEALWKKRVAAAPKRHQASYGVGTWILGEERARAGLEPEAEENSDSGKSPEQLELEERTRRYLENLERQRLQSQGQQGEATPEDWWRQASPSERFQWLLAYYAEFSGDYAVTNVAFDNCPTCGGTGVVATTELTAQGGRERKQRCPTCHGVGVRRSLTFR